MMEQVAPNISDEGTNMLGEKLLELTDAQKQMWLLEQLNPNSPTNYVNDLVVRITTPVDPEIVKKCFHEIIKRHESLRTTISTVNGQAKQIVHPKGEMDFSYFDLQHTDSKTREKQAVEIVTKEARKPYDLEAGPLIRTVLIKLAESEYILSVPIHHIVADGWSTGVIVKDFLKYYQAMIRNEEPDLPKMGIQYSEYLDQMDSYRDEEKLQKQLSYWKDQLTGELPVLNLPSDFSKRGIHNTEGARVPLALPSEMIKGLKEVANLHGVTLFSVLLAAYYAYLYRLTNQDDIIVGIPTAGRKGRKTRNLVGLFINTMALRTKLYDSLSFETLLEEINSKVWMGLRNQDVPFTTVVEEVHPDRELGRTSLYQTMFVFQNWPMPEADLPEIKISPVMVDPKKSTVDLAVMLMETDFGIHGWLEYSTNLFKAETVERYARYYLKFLDEVIKNPKVNISDLSLISTEERNQLLITWNKTESEYPTSLGIHDFLEEQVKKSPSTIAISDENQELSYQELNQRANQLAHYLRRVGVKKGDVVGFCVRRSVEMITGLIGIMKSGGVFLPMDPTYPKERLAVMLEDSGAAVVITEEALLGVLPDFDGKILVIEEEKNQILTEDTENLKVGVEGEDLAYLIYTSGTTGKPKGVPVRQQSLVNHALDMGERMTIQEGDRILQYISISFDAGLEGIFPFLLRGGTLVIAENPAELVGTSLISLVEKEKINYLHLPVSVWHQTVSEMERQDIMVPDGLKHVLVGGEQVEIDRLQGWIDRLVRPMVFMNAYGPTETTITATTYKIALEPGKSIREERIPIGKPISNVRVYVLDDHGEPVPVGVPGELYIGGAGVSSGYHNRKQETENAFIKDWFDGNGKLYRTGDMVRYQGDGNLIFLGRKDEQVKLRGYRIELGEIESVLRDEDTIDDAVVILREDLPGIKMLVAYLVGDEHIDEKELAEKLDVKLPGFMIPGAFVWLDEIPLTPNGKINRKGLPAPDLEYAEGYISPRTRLEEILAGMWEDLLGLDRISIKSNFFDLGGNSLLGATLINRLQSELGEYLYLVALFDAPTIEELAAYLEENYPVGVSRMLGEEVEGGKTELLEVQMAQEDIEGLRNKVITLPPRKEAPQSSINKPAVFILSAPRSGSTLLRTVLGGNPALFAPPELQLMNFNSLKDQSEAFANERDNFWLDGVVMALMNLRGWSETEARLALARWANEGMSVREFYGEIQNWLGERIFVDKTPNYALDPKMLARIEEDFREAKYIHLVRHPYGMIPSFENAKLHVFYPPFLEEDTKLSVREMAEAIWTISQDHINNFLANIPDERQFRVSYEALVTKPEDVIRDICQFLGIDFHEDMLYPQKDPEKRMTSTLHELSRMVGDVRFFEHEGISGSGAYRWQDEFRGDFLAEMTWEIAEKLGYHRDDLPKLDKRGAGVEISPVSREMSLPLSFAQQRLWFMDQLEPGGSTYNMPGSFRLVGELNIKALQKSLETIIRRHEILRTRFILLDGEPIQKIDPPYKVEIPLVDLSHLPEKDRENEWHRLAREESLTPFDLSMGPLLRVKLIKEASDIHIILLTLHHIVADAWSIGIFVREFVSLYDSFLQGQEFDLLDLPIQYADYSVWQRNYLQGEVLERHMAYWREKLYPPPPVLELPTDYIRPRVQTFEGENHTIRLPEKVVKKVKNLTRKTDTTPFMVFLTAYMAVLHRYTGETDICVGTPLANRGRKEIEGLIGFFVNLLAMRCNFQENPSFLDLLTQVKDFALSAFNHQELPFEMLVDALEIERDPSRNPIFDVAFQYQNADVGKLKMSGLQLQEIDSDFSAAKLDLMFSMTELEPGKIRGIFEYNKALFAKDTIERMGRHYLNLLDEVIENPEKKVSDIHIIGKEELQTLIYEWNSTAVSYPRGQDIIGLIEAQVRENPDLEAVRLDNESLTYSELNERANQLGQYLRSYGLLPNQVVGLCVERSFNIIIGLLGILKAGGVFLPLDPSYPKDRLDFMLEDSDAKYLLTQDKFLALFDQFNGELIRLDGQRDVIEKASTGNLELTWDGEAIAYIVYTSGTTGIPKGVMVRRSNLMNNTLAVLKHFQLQPGDRMLQFVSITFDPSFEEMLPVLIVGGTIVMAKNPAELVGSSFLDFVENENINYIHVPASVFHQTVLEMERLDLKVPESMKFALVGAEALSLDRLRQWAKRVQKPIRFINAYGPTENSCSASLYELVIDSDTEFPEERIPIGKPIDNVRIYLLDENLNPVPIGVPGEIYLGGDNVAAGYLNLPDETDASFLPDPFFERPGAKMYKTGDLAKYLTDGNLDFLGRIDEQVKLRGYRIELGEIETVLKSVPGMEDAATILREDENGIKILVAYLIGNEDARSTSLDQYLANRLPAYMIPTAYVWMDEFPLLAHGKIDRKRLPAPVLKMDEDFKPPQTHLERYLSEMWFDLLGVKEISVNSNFFRLGGNSLLAATFVNRLKGDIGEDLKMVTLFEKPTIYSLSLYLEEQFPLGVKRLLGEAPKEEDDALKIYPVPRDGSLPLSFAQWRLWYMHRLEPSGYVYNVPNFFRLVGKLDLDALRKGLHLVIERHEVLRSKFPVVDGEAVQVIDPILEVEIPVIDLSEMPEMDREAEADRLTNQEVYKPFDLENGPIIRVSVIRFSEQDHIVLITLHHIAADAWSLGILIREFSVAYESYLNGQEVYLPELPIQYVDYAVWQRGYLKGEIFESQMRYWRNQLTPLPPALDLPTSRIRPQVQTFKGKGRQTRLPADLVRMAKSLNQEMNTTLFMVLLAGYFALLHRYTGEEDISIGTPIANRGSKETENLIGFFVNMLVMRGDISNDPTFRQLLERVRQTAMDAFNYQNLPFEMIVEELHPEKDASRNPLFQVGFQFQNADTGELQLPGLELKEIYPDFGVARLDIMLSLTEVPGELIRGVFRYNTDLFDDETIERLESHFIKLLYEILSNPDLPISSISLVTDEERNDLVTVRNDTDEPYPAEKGIHILFEEQVRRTPNAVALRVNGDELTYSALNERANQLAHTLFRMGVRKNVVVGLFLERSLDMIVGLLGILKAGGVYLPIDPGYPSKRLEFMIKDACVKYIVTKANLLENLHVYRGETICLDRDIDEIRWNSPHNPETTGRGDDLVYIIYTSGTTGVPKGVKVRHRNLVNHASWMKRRLRMKVGERILGYFSISFDGAVDWIYPTLLSGGTIVIATNPAELVGTRLLNYIEEENINYLHLPASVFHHTVSEMDLLDRSVPESIKLVLLGGEQVNLENLQIWTDRLTKSTRFLNAYGPTETTVAATMFEALCQPGRGYSYPRVPIGRPVPNVRVYVLDERGEPVPEGLPGELYIGGAGVTAGYLNNEEENKKAFLEDYFEGHGKLYRTGDMVRYLSDGNLIYLGRKDEQVKLRGYRIELSEIETALREDKNIEEAVVILREDVPGVKLLVAYLIGEEKADKDLIQSLEKRLPGYMLPSAFVWIDEVPLTPNGKIDRQALPKPTLTAGEVFVKPRTKLEEVLAALWGELLGLDELSVQSNFFDLGGNSLLGATMVNRLQAELGEYLYLVALFDAPTIEKLAIYLKENYPVGVRRMLGEDVDTIPDTTVVRKIGDNDFNQLRSVVSKLGPRKVDDGAPTNDSMAFILSAPRSGSTLLRAILGGNPKLFAPPELQLMNYNSLSEQAEALGNERDSFWLDGVVVAMMNLTGWSETEAREALARWADEGMSIRVFYGKMLGLVGDRLFVDKTPNYALDPDMLARMEEDFKDTKYIHLVRHPLAMIPSFEKAKLHVFYPPFLNGETELSVREMAEAIWTISQEHIIDFLDHVPHERKLFVRYEDLVTEPEKTVSDICDFLGVEFQNEMLNPQDDPEKRMTGALHELSHMIGDVRFFEHDGISASAAYRWQKNYKGDFLAERTWKIAAELGYLREDLPEKKESATRILTVEQTQPLVAIQPKGSKPPLFMGHAGGGIVFPYYNLVPFMPDQPIYGLQDPSVYSQELVYSDIQEMAEDYVQWIQKVQPKGPYRLAGWSFGGNLVFEIAHNLIQKGEEIAFVGLIDTWLKPPNFYMVHKDDVAQEKVEKIFNSIRQTMRRFFKVIKGTASVVKSIIPHLRNGFYFMLSRKLSSEDKKQKMSQVFDKILGIAMTTEFLKGSEFAELANQEKHLLELNIPSSMGRVMQLVRIHQKYATKYTPKPLPAKIHIIYGDWNREAIENHGNSPTLGWEEYSTVGAEIVWTHGNHSSLLTKPDVEGLANVIAKILDDVSHDKPE